MKKSILFLLICTAIYSCKKKDETPEPASSPIIPVTYDNYSNLKTGNYWIYERFNLDSLGGTYTSLNVFDSSYVEKDTLINGSTYYKLMTINYPDNNQYVASYFRDSLHYIISYPGKIIFSSLNFTDTFYTHHIVQQTNDTICYVYSKMADDNFSVALPAGNFVTKNFKTTYLMWPNYSFNGPERPMHCRYAKNVGLVEQTLPFYLLPPNYIVRRLKRYGSA